MHSRSWLGRGDFRFEYGTERRDLPAPGVIDLPAGPDDQVARRLLKRHVREVWFYGGDSSGVQSGWRLRCTGGTKRLQREAIDLLPRTPDTAIDQAFFRSADPLGFLDRR